MVLYKESHWLQVENKKKADGQPYVLRVADLQKWTEFSASAFLLHKVRALIGKDCNPKK